MRRRACAVLHGPLVVLALLAFGVRGAAAEPVPDVGVPDAPPHLHARALALAAHAEADADEGRCETAISVDREIAQLDPAHYVPVFATRPAIAECLSPRSLSTRANRRLGMFRHESFSIGTGAVSGADTGWMLSPQLGAMAVAKLGVAVRPEPTVRDRELQDLDDDDAAFAFLTLGGGLRYWPSQKAFLDASVGWAWREHYRDGMTYGLGVGLEAMHAANLAVDLRVDAMVLDRERFWFVGAGLGYYSPAPGHAH